jgi:hypothetical protein
VSVEQELIEMLLIGFSIIMGISFITVLILLLLLSPTRRSYRTSYLFVLLHFVIFSLAVQQLLKSLTLVVNSAMASKEVSLKLGIGGILWVISMVFLLIALASFSLNTKNKT